MRCSILAASLLLACSGDKATDDTGRNSETDADADSDTDADTDTDTDTDSDTDTDTDTDPPTVLDGRWVGQCEPDFTSPYGTFDHVLGIDFDLTLDETGGQVDGTGTLSARLTYYAYGGSGGSGLPSTPGTYTSSVDVTATGSWDGVEVSLVFTGIYPTYGYPPSGYTTPYSTTTSGSPTGGTVTNHIPAVLIASLQGDALTGTFTFYPAGTYSLPPFDFACTGSRY